ncbi:MAG: TonB-dependent receptor [Gammaproteobacteria bacterium]|nr:TonB-dependent receptor [Gammaproteobacteria bacterium]
MKILQPGLACLCMAVMPLHVYADLGPIVITPTRTEQAQNKSSATVYVVTADEIEKSGASTTSEVLRGIPGIQIDDLFGNGNEVNISLRGFSSSANANTLVLVNGRRINYSDTASPDLHHVFPKDIERIEVLAGSAGSLYGDQAVGGVINIITKRPADGEHQVSVRSGSFDYQGIQFNSSMKLSESLGYRISAESFDSDNYRDHNEEENTNFSGVLEYQRAENTVFVELQRIDNKLELPGALLENEFEDDPTQINPGFVDDFRDEEISVIRLGYARKLGAHRFSIDATQRETEADILQSFRDFPSPEAGFDNRESNSINPKLSGSFNAGVEISYVIGIDLEETDYELEIPFDFFGPGVQTASNEQDTESLYLQINPRLTDRLQLTFGMRSSSVENDMSDGFSFANGIEVDDDISVGELGLAYFVDEQILLRLRYDQNFRFAKVNELAQAAPGNILDTQTGDSFEIGIDLTRGDHQLTLSLYRLDLENEIEFDPNAGLFGENVNLDNTRRDGITFSLYSQLSMAFGLKTEVGVVDAEFRSGSFEGKDISGVADTIASLRGDYRVNDQFSAYLEYNYSSPKYAQGDNANDFGKLGSITVYNAGVAYQFKLWDVNLRINNLADESYAEFVTNNGAYYPSPERNYTLTATYRFE